MYTVRTFWVTSFVSWVQNLINIWANSSAHCTPEFDVISRRSVIQNSGKQILKPKCKWSSFSQLFSEVCFSALQLTLRSTLIPKHQSCPSQNLCKHYRPKNWKRSNPSSVVKAFHAKLPVTRITSEICTCVPRYSTCKQSAARSETPKAWLPCCKAVGRKKDPPAITQITSLVLFSRLPGNSLQLPLKFNCHIAIKLFTTHKRTKTHRI